MAAPQTTPDLSVISPETSSDGARAASAPPSGKARKAGWRVPGWLLVAVALLGAVLWYQQFARARQLDARVVSLTAELKTAGEQLGAYQAHLESVRSGMGDLSAQVASLKSLVDRDPLAPVAQGEETASGTTPVASDRVAPGEPSGASTALSPSQTLTPSQTLPITSTRVDLAEALGDANSDSVGSGGLGAADGGVAPDSVRSGALSAPFGGGLE